MHPMPGRHAIHIYSTKGIFIHQDMQDERETHNCLRAVAVTHTPTYTPSVKIRIITQIIAVPIILLVVLRHLNEPL